MLDDQQMTLLKYLEAKGITLDDLITTALEFFVPHPGVDSREKAIQILTDEFHNVFSDVDVSCLVVACYLAEDEARAGRIPNLSVERFLGRPGLVADELLGMTIANYIAGARGVFEFVRFDQQKPGILSKLGPIVNDAIGGLIAGCSSNMYSAATRRSQMV
jgi:alpha-ribazole phosphatase CobZ